MYRLKLYIFSLLIGRKMEAPRRVVYPLHITRAILRGVGSLFLFLAFCLFIADGIDCDKAVNGFDNTNTIDGLDEGAASVCWTDALYGDLRPLIIVRGLILICTMTNSSAFVS